ncbi:hypothetical protein [Desulfofalx alkaliphila]|uniref:hypothetical protein n=1 Tax=Desulfofalx alkaliphila TaxID=105483 RepID=UPI000B102863|nr:hypothetical protein [Desulfofalx alkaliphila]
MPRRVKGILKKAGSGEPAAETAQYGYRNPWDTGKASYYKRLYKTKGVNRPST